MGHVSKSQSIEIQNHLSHIWYDVLLFIFNYIVFLNVISYTTLNFEIDGTFCKYAFGYGPKDIYGNPNKH